MPLSVGAIPCGCPTNRYVMWGQSLVVALQTVM